MACGVEFLGRLEYRLCTQCGSGVVAGEQCLEFSDDLLGGGFRDQLALNLERLVQERGSLLAGHAQDSGIVGRAPVGVREPDPHDLVPGLGFE